MIIQIKLIFDLEIHFFYPIVINLMLQTVSISVSETAQSVTPNKQSSLQRNPSHMETSPGIQYTSLHPWVG